jgi:hypothetical protein
VLCEHPPFMARVLPRLENVRTERRPLGLDERHEEGASVYISRHFAFGRWVTTAKLSGPK